MRKIYLLLYILLLGAVQVHAQRVSRDFHNVTMPKALQQLGGMTHRYTINFIYNDLEDFRVTAAIKGATIPEAIRHLIGFYPISMTMVGDSIINVECSQKTVLRYKGRVVDDKGEPAEYANVVLLSPADSSFLAGGVSNESGYFVIPCNARRVIAKVTYVGYKSKLWTAASPDLGTIRLQADRYTLKGVTVQGHKLSYKPSPNGLSVMVKGSQLEQFGSAKEMIKHLPLVMGDGTVAGHGTPQIYINNKLVRDASELERLQTAEVLSAEIITRPGAEYASDVTSVIRLKTVRRQGEGWSGSLWGNFEKSKGMLATANASLNYRLRNGMDFFIRANAADSKGRITATSNDQLKATDTWDYHSRTKWRNDYKFIYGDVGWNWEINDRHSLGLTYSATGTVKGKRTITKTEQVWRNGEHFSDDDNQSVTKSKPNLANSVNTYYVGRLGKWGIDFSADYYGSHTDMDMAGGTDDSSVSSNTSTRSNLWAEKLTVSAPMPAGTFSFGEETSYTNRKADFTQSGFSADTHIRQRTAIWSLYANYALPIGKKLNFSASLRLQNEHNRYDVDGKKDDELSHDYHVLIPKLSMSYADDGWQHSLAFATYRYNPPYSIMSSSVNYRSKYEYDTGNPFLQPMTTYYLSWTTVWKWMTVEAYYAYIKNSFRTFQTAYDDVSHPGVIITDYRNTPKTQNYGVTLNTSPTLGIWHLNYTAMLFFSDADLAPMGITHYWNGLCTQFRLDNTFTLPYNWTANITASLTPYNKSEVAITKTVASVDLRISKQWLKSKNIRLSLYANDIFHTNYKEMTAYGGINVRTQFKEYDSTQCVGIEFTYSFNTVRSRYKGTSAGSEEKNRL